MPAAELPEVVCVDRAAWRGWLSAQHEVADGVWLRLAKKTSGLPSVTYPEAVEEALCFGWIDGKSRTVDETHYLVRFTPRRRRSPWSAINRAKALALIEAGQMEPAGLREVERAQQDGRWDAAYSSPLTAAVPDDLQAALAADHAAAVAFAGLDRRNRYAILSRLELAKRPETRQRRIASFVEMLRDGRTPSPLAPAADRGPGTRL